MHFLSKRILFLLGIICLLFSQLIVLVSQSGEINAAPPMQEPDVATDNENDSHLNHQLFLPLILKS
ncbi:MAG: hypothetical protein AAF629_10800, partial [Chloroflexota bacterium]